MKSLGWALMQYTGVLIRKGKFQYTQKWYHVKTQTQGRQSHERGGRDWSLAVINQITSGDYQKLGRAMKETLLEVLEEHSPAHNLISDCSLQNCEIRNSFVLSHLVHSSVGPRTTWLLGAPIPHGAKKSTCNFWFPKNITTNSLPCPETLPIT